MCVSSLCMTLIALSVISSSLEVDVEYRTTSLTQSQAQHYCDLFGSEQTEFDTLPATTIQISTTKQSPKFSNLAWVSMRATLTKWLNFRGCFERSPFDKDIKSKKISELKGDILFSCIKFCNETTIFLTNERCICRTGVLYSVNTGCDGVKCGADLNTYCGQNEKCLCLYSYLESDYILGNYIENPYKGNCMTLEHRNGKPIFKNDDCSVAKPFVCEDGQTDRYFVSSNRYNEQDHLWKPTKWVDAGINCRLKSTTFTPSKRLNISILIRDLPEDRNFWISLFRSALFSWGNPNSLDTDICVAAEFVSNTTMHLKTRNCSDRLSVLCITKTDSNTSAQSSEPLRPAYIVLIVVLVLCLLIVFFVFLIIRKRKKTRKGSDSSVENTSHIRLMKKGDTSDVIEVKETSQLKNNTTEAADPGCEDNRETETSISHPEDDGDKCVQQEEEYDLLDKSIQNQDTPIDNPEYDSMANIMKEDDDGAYDLTIHQSHSINDISCDQELDTYDTMVNLK